MVKAIVMGMGLMVAIFVCVGLFFLFGFHLSSFSLRFFGLVSEMKCFLRAVDCLVLRSISLDYQRIEVNPLSFLLLIPIRWFILFYFIFWNRSVLVVIVPNYFF